MRKHKIIKMDKDLRCIVPEISNYQAPDDFDERVKQQFY
jgi:hypothetical protein